jgi:Ca-activated chloride channel family protein
MTTHTLRLFLSFLALMMVFFSCHQDDSFAPSLQFEVSTPQDGEESEPGTIIENPFVLTSEENTSTFSIDADGGAYANVRRYLEQDDVLPPPEAIPTEEFINYFDLDYPFIDTGHPISLNGEVSGCPWSESNRLIRIGIEGKSIPEQERPFSNFVFLIDVSGSMASDDKLELIKTGMHRFVDQMRDPDHLSIVTYAGSTQVHLGSTSGSNENSIRLAIDRLSTDGGTNGGAGINLAYDEAAENFIPGGNNRIFLATDGDFNVGITNFDELIELIEIKRESGVFLTTLVVGRTYSEQVLE